MTDNILGNFINNSKLNESEENELDQNTNTRLSLDNNTDQGLTDDNATISNEENNQSSEDKVDNQEQDISDDSNVKKADNSAYAKMRIANKKAEERVDALTRSLDEITGYVKANQERDADYQKYQEQKKLVEEKEKFQAQKPDVLDDPDGYSLWLKEQIKQELESEYSSKIKNLETKVQETSAISEQQQLRSHLTTSEQQYSKIDTEYNNKKEFFLKSIANELKIQYPSATDDQIAEEIRQGEINLAVQSWNNNSNPSKVFADLAVSRGYKSGSNNKISATNNNQKRSVSMVGKTGATVRTGDFNEEDFSNMDLASKMKNYDSMLKFAKSNT